MISILENIIKKGEEPEFPKLMIHKQHAMVVLFAQNLERGTVVWANRQKTFYNVGDYSIGWNEDDFVEFKNQEIILRG
jgi:hypothetical protein